MLINKGDTSLNGGRWRGGLKGGRGMSPMSRPDSVSDATYTTDDNRKSIPIIKKGILALESFEKLENDDDKRKLITSLQNKLCILHIKLIFELGIKWTDRYSYLYFNTLAVYSVIIKIMYYKINNIKTYTPNQVYKDIPEVKNLIDSRDSRDIEFEKYMSDAIEHIILEYKVYAEIKDNKDYANAIIIVKFEHSLEYCREAYTILNISKENIDEMYKYEEDIIYRDITIVYNQLCQYDLSTRYDELIKYYNTMHVNIETLLIQYIFKVYILHNLKLRYDLGILSESTEDDTFKKSYEKQIIEIEEKCTNVEDIYSVYEEIKTMGKDNNFIKYCMNIIDMLKTKMSH